MGTIRDSFADAYKAKITEQMQRADCDQRRREFWLTMEAVFIPRFVDRLRKWAKS